MTVSVAGASAGAGAGVEVTREEVRRRARKRKVVVGRIVLCIFYLFFSFGSGQMKKSLSVGDLIEKDDEVNQAFFRSVLLSSVCFDGERKTKTEMGGLYTSFPPAPYL
jgi:hypothetical protein